MSTHKQLAIFDCTEPVKKVDKHATIWRLFIDGASRKNPGIAGAGIYLVKNDNEVVKKKGFYLGHKTNNQAEYYALLLGVFTSKHVLEADDLLYIVSDSELLIKQLKQEYKVKNPELQRLYQCALALLKGINYSFCHVLREYNTQADAMANHGIDQKGGIPAAFLKMLQSHDISF